MHEGQFELRMSAAEGYCSTPVQLTVSVEDALKITQPIVKGLTIVADVRFTEGALLAISDGAGGWFGGIVLAGGGSRGIQASDCGNERHTAAAPMSIDNATTLYISPYNLIQLDSRFSASVFTDASCANKLEGGTSFYARQTLPGFVALEPYINLTEAILSSRLNPLPTSGGAMCKEMPEPLPFNDSTILPAACSGAFVSPHDSWLWDLSWLHLGLTVLPPPTPPVLPPPPPSSPVCLGDICWARSAGQQ